MSRGKYGQLTGNSSAGAPVEVKIGSGTNTNIMENLSWWFFSKVGEASYVFFKGVKTTEPSVLSPQDHGKGTAFKG